VASPLADIRQEGDQLTPNLLNSFIFRDENDGEEEDEEGEIG